MDPTDHVPEPGRAAKVGITVVWAYVIAIAVLALVLIVVFRVHQHGLASGLIGGAAVVVAVVLTIVRTRRRGHAERRAGDG